MDFGERLRDVVSAKRYMTPHAFREAYVVDEKFKPDGYNVGWNVGTIGGQKVFHAHLHIIPRFMDEPFAGKGIRYWFKQDENKRHSKEM